MIPFPCDTAPRATAVGFPVEARACACGDRRIVQDDTCLFCGCYPAHVIRATWASRAQEVTDPDDRGGFLSRLRTWVLEALA